MSGVDVLAAMDEAAAAIEGCWAIYEGAKNLIEARAAVAELIAAAADMENVAGIRGDQLQRFVSLRAALARVRP